ncbi:hypothetical protein ACROYT_G033794 [Oculina patagonica]
MRDMVMLYEKHPRILEVFWKEKFTINKTQRLVVLSGPYCIGTTEMDGVWTNDGQDYWQIARCFRQEENSFTAPSPRGPARIAVDDELKLIYGVIPKVATTTWKTVFRSARGIRGGMSRWILWKRFSNYTEEERSKRLQTYFKFVFVREPLQRLLSAYKNKFIQKPRASNDIRRVIVQAFRPQDFEPEGENFVSFSEFIQYFSNNISRNRHWRQYEKLSHPCVINYDFIGHFETMEEDGPLVLKMAGIADRVTFPPIHKSTGTDEVLEYYSQVPPEYITRIGELYRSDFEMFGYEYLGPVKKLLNQSTIQKGNLSSFKVPGAPPPPPTVGIIVK